MKAVVLIGGVSAWLYPLAHRRPRAMLRVGDRPAVAHLLLHLARQGVTEALMPLAPSMEWVREELGQDVEGKIRITYAVERKYNGAAAGAGLFREKLVDAPFLLINGNAASRLTLAPLMAAPEGGGPFLNVGVYAGVEGMRSFGAKHTASSPSSPGEVFWEDHTRSLAHAYVMHPALLDLIPRGKYCDMREQLIPQALSAGITVRGVPLEGTINEMRSLQDFMRANHDAVREAQAEGRVLVSPEAQVDPTAVLSGPVMVGEGARIRAESVIVGPAVIGPWSVVGRGAVVTQSLLGPHARVGRHSQLQRSIVFRRSKVLPRRRLNRSVVMDGIPLLKGHMNMLREVADGASWNVVTHQFQDQFHVQDRLAYRIAKRTLDLVAVAVLAVPVFLAGLVIAALVRVTSQGPALYRERRMTRKGKEFWMVKFRTMYTGAHLDQSKYKDQNQTDGPMFKIIHDPRITPVGNWLRKTSLDELPQLWNVLKGEMSLVGPRPLADREMRWHPVWRALRLQVKPGMTGLWQVKCGGHSDFADWIGYDVHYIQNACLSLDFWILLKTVGVVFFGRRAAEA